MGENAEKLEYEIYLKDPMICKRVDGEEEELDSACVDSSGAGMQF